MELSDVMTELESYGNERTKGVLIKHGAKEPFFGVKVQDLKKILKKTKKNHELSLQLYATGNSDAMYLAGLMADESKITIEELNVWVEQAYWYYLSEFTVPWVAADTPFGFDLGMSWRLSDSEHIAAAGWSTLASYAIVTANDDLDVNQYRELMHEVKRFLPKAKNRVRYAMNGFVIACGVQIPELTDEAIKIGEEIGPVKVELGGTACKVPLAKDYIAKARDSNRLGKKKKTARC